MTLQQEWNSRSAHISEMKLMMMDRGFTYLEEVSSVLGIDGTPIRAISHGGIIGTLEYMTVGGHCSRIDELATCELEQLRKDLYQTIEIISKRGVVEYRVKTVSAFGRENSHDYTCKDVAMQTWENIRSLYKRLGYAMTGRTERKNDFVRELWTKGDVKHVREIEFSYVVIK